MSTASRGWLTGPGAEAETLDIGDASQFVAEPAAGLRAGVTGKEAHHAELVVDLVPDLLAAEMPHPGGMLAGSHAEGHAGEERQAEHDERDQVGGGRRARPDAPAYG